LDKEFIFKKHAKDSFTTKNWEQFFSMGEYRINKWKFIFAYYGNLISLLNSFSNERR